jgi:hypothetical protein
MILFIYVIDILVVYRLNILPIHLTKRKELQMTVFTISLSQKIRKRWLSDEMKLQHCAKVEIPMGSTGFILGQTLICRVNEWIKDECLTIPENSTLTYFYHLDKQDACIPIHSTDIVYCDDVSVMVDHALPVAMNYYRRIVRNRTVISPQICVTYDCDPACFI